MAQRTIVAWCYRADSGRYWDSGWDPRREADTTERFAFNVNKFRKVYKCEEFYTKNEREFIFPMYKEHIKEYRMTIKEFIQMKEQQGN